MPGYLIILTAVEGLEYLDITIALTLAEGLTCLDSHYVYASSRRVSRRVPG